VTVIATGGPATAKITHTVSVSFAIPGVAYTVTGSLGPLISGKDLLALNGRAISAQTGISPVNQPASPPNPAAYTPLGVLITASNSSGAVALDCTGATATLDAGNGVGRSC
jgi:hypothetical protein